MTDTVRLSGRLTAIRDLVAEAAQGCGGRLCDVGCDHAHVPIRLLQDKIIDAALCMDIIPGPLEKAAQAVAEYGMQEKIELRMSDGLDEFCAGDADILLISGMGGTIEADILLREQEKTKSLRAMVLQPQSDQELVRDALHDLGFAITDERLVEENGKYYIVMLALPAIEESRPDWKEEGFLDVYGSALCFEAERSFGPVLIARRDEVLKRFLENRTAKTQSILEEMKKAGNTDRKNLMEHSLELMRMVQMYTKGEKA